ncbi:MAG: hypothetical protein WA364_11035 [Candidatus Nitrosopolaris sp.]
MTKKTRIIGIVLIAIGVSVFGTSYHLGTVNQDIYSKTGCAVDPRPKQCMTSNNEIIAGFMGMIFGFFTILYAVYLVMPSVLMKVIADILPPLKSVGFH